LKPFQKPQHDSPGWKNLSANRVTQGSVTQTGIHGQILEDIRREILA